MKNELVKALSTAIRAVSTKAAIPALQGFLLKATDNKVVVNAFNLEIGIITAIPAQVKAEGEIVVAAKLLQDIVKKSPEEEILIYTDDTITYIESGKSSFSIVNMSSLDYPDIPELLVKESLTIDSEALISAIKKTRHCISENSAKPVYTGSLIKFAKDSLQITAVDGYKLATYTIPANNMLDTEVVVPKRAQDELVNLIDDEETINIAISAKHISFSFGETTIFSRLIEGDFLNYKDSIPKDVKTKITVSKALLHGVADRMSVLSNDKITSPVKIDIKDDVTLSISSTIGKSKETIPSLFCTVNGEPVVIGINVKYLNDCLKSFSTDQLIVNLSGPLSPITIEPVSAEGYEQLNLIVPMRMSKNQ